MAGGTICTELTSVFLWFGMTIDTSSGNVKAGVVEGRIFPIGWDVTRLALRSILPVMFVSLSMAGITILRERLHVCNGACIQMALGTCYVGMSAVEFKGIGIVIEVVKTIHPVVTGKAIAAKREQMSLGEGNVHVAVTGLARVRGEGCYVIAMTIFTSNRIARFFPLVFV